MTIALQPGLERRLKASIEGDVMLDAFSRGRYATDASIYQMMPLGVVVPRTMDDVRAAIAVAREEGVPVLPRGGGTSQCGQTVNEALVIDNSKHLNRLLTLDVESRTCVVEPGMVLDDLNRQLKPHGLWFPVDVSTSSRATIGGMTANNSCGGRSIRYGRMRENVNAIDAVLADGSEARFGEVAHDLAGLNAPIRDHFAVLLKLGAREADEIAGRFPKVLRRVGGYNIDALVPNGASNNLAHLLVGSEGTLAYSTAIELKLSPIPRNKVMGICHFASFYEAMDATQHLVTLGPSAVELVDATMIALAREIELFRPTVERCVRGEPEALLLVEFAEDSEDQSLRLLKRLSELMGDLGFSWEGHGKSWGGVVEAVDPGTQSAVTEMRKSGLNIMMSMKQEGKPVSFVEDCAVELPDLADYTAGLTEIFTRHDTKGTWYAHASVGCLHVRPILNMKTPEGARTMRAIAEEAFDLVAEYKGSHSGEHGDGIVRSEFHEKMFGSRLVKAFEEVKQSFDPSGLFNPGKITRAPRMDDRTLFRFPPDYTVQPLETELDWSRWPGQGGGFQGAIEMCNNNGACRKLAGGVMCPSFRATRNERDVTRGRANSLRLAISGQLGPNALTSDAMADTMSLCLSCKGCRRECPTGVDMARMKIEVLAARAKRHGLTLHDRLVAYLPRYAPWAARAPWLANLRDRVPGLAGLLEGATGFSAKRPLPKWRDDVFRDPDVRAAGVGQVVLLADTFNRYFEPDNLRAAQRVLTAAGVEVVAAKPADGGRPLCCGRTFLSAGLVDEARHEARRMIEALRPHVERGTPIVGLEPSCLLTLRDEFEAMLPGDDTRALSANAVLFEEFLVRETAAGRLDLPLKAPAERAVLHGHCHQKAFDVMGDVEKVLGLVPGMSVEKVDAGCCGMAGAFGYGRETYNVSMQIGEQGVLPAVRGAAEDALIVADGTSCRHQIADGTGRAALHVARVLEMALDS